MEKLSVREARQTSAIGRQIVLQGWIRTRQHIADEQPLIDREAVDNEQRQPRLAGCPSPTCQVAGDVMQHYWTPVALD